jgi:hypothetical protein
MCNRKSNQDKHNQMVDLADFSLLFTNNSDDNDDDSD